MLALDLPILGAYFPTKFHQYFKVAGGSGPIWSSTRDFRGPEGPPNVIYLIGGSVDFLHRILQGFPDHQRVIITVSWTRRGATRTGIQRSVKAGHALLALFNLRPLQLLDSAFGGATDCLYLLGFGTNLGSSVTPSVIKNGLPRTLRHVLDGGTEGRFRSIPKELLPALNSPARTVLIHNGVARPEGLLPCRSPNIHVYAPSYKLRDRWVIRELTLTERFRLHQLPLYMDTLLGGLNPRVPLPFEDSPSPEIYTSLFRQLWGVTGGGVDASLPAAAELSEAEPAVDTSEVNILVAAEPSEAEPAVDILAAAEPLEAEPVVDNKVSEFVALDLTGSMTASKSTGPDMPSRSTSRQNSQRTTKDSDRLTDDDTVTSLASEETTCHCNKDDPEDELGPAPKTEPGPPFAVGQVIMCDVPTHLHGGIPFHSTLERGFIVEADHPRYRIRLERGATVWTSTMESWLTPRWAPGEFAPDQDDPFATLRGDPSLKIGSYGIHVDAQLDSLEKVVQSKAFSKAVKADDADIPVQLWNSRVKVDGISDERRDWALDVLRKLGHRRFIKVLVRDCLEHMRTTHCTKGRDMWKRPRRSGADGRLNQFGRDREAIAGILWHSFHTNWFEYNAGSRLIHFRFPERYRAMARDGVEVYFEQPGPTTREAQPVVSDPKLREMAKAKILKVVKRRYLKTDGIKIKSLIKYFAVPKGEDDIRLVYDATANRLNECVWAPPFWLPTIDTLVRGTNKDSWMTDRDVGDMFLNFQLHESVVPYTGVDLSSLYEDKDDAGPRWAVWDRNLMGFASSPYASIRMALVVEEVCRGDRHENGLGLDGKELNPFQWDHVRLNLPGTKEYDPCTSWLTKVRLDGRMACDVYSFVDDERVTGPDEDLTWQASHALASKQSYLGMQDAGRKARPCSHQPGAWAGAIVHVLPDLGVCVLTSVEKWERLKAILQKWADRLDAQRSPGTKIRLAHKELLSDRGFLVYVTRTYPPMVPYLKGFHLTIEMWRGGRDEDGWKVTSKEDEDQDDQEDEDEDDSRVRHRMGPKRVSPEVHAPEDGLTTPVPRLRDDIAALTHLSQFKLPPLRVVRPSHVVQVFYGFGDASGKQFGATLSKNYNCRGRLSEENLAKEGIRYRIGLWSPEEEEESSNYKELKNLVDTIKEEAGAGRLRDCELFIFTDNSTAEGCFYRGTSKSRYLHALVLDLRKLEMVCGMTIHVVHISGRRMIAQGTDGCSRGSMMEGVMAGKEMLSFVDLARTAIERHPPLLDWVRSWTNRSTLEPLTPEAWFQEGHGITGGYKDKHGIWIPNHEPKGNLHLWAPPPAVAAAALEEILKARHKRTDTYHVVLIPRLMTPTWRRLFMKSCDFTFVVSPNCSFWPDDMFEPLWVGVLLPFSTHRPWSFKRAPLLVEMGRELREVLAKGETDGGDILRKLLDLPRTVAKMSERVARGVLHVPERPTTVSYGGHRRRAGKPMAQGRRKTPTS